MVAERSTKRPVPLAAMAATRPGTPRQPTLAEEIDELEMAGKVTAALQAEVESHGMVRESPTGQEPQEQHPGVTNTPKRSPKIGKTPSPVRVDKDGATRTLEDDDEGQEEQEESESGVDGGDLARVSADSRACAESVAVEGSSEKTPNKKSGDTIVK